MNEASKVIESLKLATYEIFAILLPGLLAVAPLWSDLGESLKVKDSGSPGLVIASFIVGLALQGLARLFFGKLFWRPRAKSDSSTAEFCKALVEKRLGKPPSDAVLFNYCLSAIGPSRTVYDKFVALRDSARGLVLAIPLCVIEAVLLSSKAWHDASNLLLMVAAFAATAAFIERFARFDSLPTLIVYSQFLAQETGKPSI